jgi:metallo-beta-lactamase family protein
MRPVNFFQFQDIPGKGTFRFLPAGHILGSAFAEIFFEDGQRILMSGDIGRWDRPILKDPTAVDFAEYLVLESTYGDRVHSEEDPLERLDTILNDVHDNHRVLLVPSFAIGRTQELLWCINELQKQGRCPRVSVYVDSPMANAATLLYAKHTDDMDKEVRVDMAEGRSPFDPHLVRFVRDKGMSKALNSAPGPMVIISGSGMASGGRIQHHLRHRLRHPETMVLFTGYQAGGTLGRELLEGATEVEIFGDPIPVQAEIAKLNSLSAHADQPEMLAWLRGFKEPPKKTFLVHGEPEVQDAWADKIRQELGWEVVVPEEGQVEVLS